MQSGKYFSILYLMLFFLLIDLFVNSFVFALRLQNVVLLILYILQDISLVFALIVVFLMFFNTYIFQAGLTSILIRKFKLTIIANVLYLALTIAFHIYDLTERWTYPDYYHWPNGLIVVFCIQRAMSVFHYYFYKRTALRLADPLFYKDSHWLRNWLRGIKSSEHDGPKA